MCQISFLDSSSLASNLSCKNFFPFFAQLRIHPLHHPSPFFFDIICFEGKRFCNDQIFLHDKFEAKAEDLEQESDYNNSYFVSLFELPNEKLISSKNNTKILILFCHLKNINPTISFNEMFHCCESNKGIFFF